MASFAGTPATNCPPTMIASQTRIMSNKLNVSGLMSFLRDRNIRLANVVQESTSAKNFPNTYNLPHLPVPKLNQTLDKYLRSVTPFLNESELSTTKKLLEEFENGSGQRLQAYLEEKAKSTDNWLADWWLNVAYLDYRDPVVVYSSPGLVFPFQDFKNEAERLTYTAKIILASVNYKLLVDGNKMPLDKMGKETLDMNQYKKIFGTCRIPGETRDSLEFNSSSTHIIIIRNNHFFKLEVLNSKGETPSVNQIINQLETILKQSDTLAPPIGVLTSENRDNWFKAYQNLTRDPTNKQSVSEIQKSLFVLALDNPMPEYNDSFHSLASKQFIHGGGSRGNAGNRWFDKTVQLVIGQDGTVGLTYEHSPSEGQPIAVMTDYIVEYAKSNIAKDLPDTKLDNGPTKLPFNVDDKINEDIRAANIHVDKLVENLDIDSFQFNGFGKEFVKSQKLSPDSFIQIAMQYAFYRIHKVPGAHYESAATRKYIHGRTETIRSCSIESIDFAKAMLNKNLSDAERVAALKNAINSHKKYSVDAVNGFGVDRHLLGLKLIALENKLDVPTLFKDVSFTRSTHMRLSTSQVATKCDGFMVYGPLTPDGYGCCYNPRSEDINFGVSAFTAHPDTSASGFRQALQNSLEDMHNILAKTQKAKL